MNTDEFTRPTRCGQKGFTLVEMVVVLVLLSLGVGLFAATYETKSKKRGDIYALRAILLMASHQSVFDSKHFGVHYSAATHSVALFQDVDEDNAFDNTDTLSTAFTLDPTAGVSILSSNGDTASNICFKKNGAVADLHSYTLTYVSGQTDTTKLLVIAASGQTFQQTGAGL